MGADNDGICAFIDMHVIGPPGDDLDGNTGKNPLAAAPVGHGRKIRREGGHKGGLVVVMTRGALRVRQNKVRMQKHAELAGE